MIHVSFQKKYSLYEPALRIFVLYALVTSEHLFQAAHTCSLASGPIAQWVRSPITDPWVVSFILAQSHIFVEIDHEIVSVVILDDSRRDVVSYKRKYVHEVLVNHLVKLAQEKEW